MPAPSTFRQHLKHSPRLCAITFQGSWAGVPFALIELCLRHPRIVSITFPEDSDWSSLKYYTAVPPPQDSYPNSLERLFYTSYPWKTTRARLTDRDRLKEHTVEAGHLGPLVLGMHSTAESLSFPVDVAPLAHMVELSWPRLRDLTLTGRFSDASQVSYMSRLVGFMSCPRSLSIQVAQLADHPRPRVLQKHQLRSMGMHGLQSLTLAYPNPDDAIFTLAGPSLRRLSLRDWPRYYTRIQWAFHSELEGLAMPVLSSSECLRILARMSMPRLQHLELVYEADAMEEELLLHVGSAYPCLESFELHQYRSVSYGSIAVRFVSCR